MQITPKIRSTARRFLPLSLIAAASIACASALLYLSDLGNVRAETNNGTLSGTISGVSPNAQFIITATGVFSDSSVGVVLTQVVGTGPYTFSSVPAGDALGFGYDSVVSYTITAAPLAPCYSIAPASHTAFLGPSGVATGLNFVASYVPFPITITTQITEAVFHPGQVPTTPVIVPPAYAKGIGNFSAVSYRVRSFDDTYDQTSTQNVSLNNTTVLTFSHLINTEPANGNCTMGYTVTVSSLLNPYQGVVNWRFVPNNATQVVTLSATSNMTRVPFLAYLHWVWTPIVIREP